MHMDQGRLRKLLSSIEDSDQIQKKGNLEAFLVLTKINRQYLSGFTGSTGILLISRKGAELFVDDRYLIRARRESWLKVKKIEALSTSLLTSPLARGEGKVRIGIEDKISLREFAKLKKDYPKVKWAVARDVVENLRAVKSAQEIKYIEKGSRLIDATFRQILKLLRKNSPNNPLFYPHPPGPGRRKRGGKGGVLKEVQGEFTEIRIAQEIQKMVAKLGADGLAFDPIVAFGPNAAAPHHFSSNQKIRRGNFLLLDFGFLVKGYHSDFTRTLFIGNPNKKQEKVYQTVLEAQARAISEIAIEVKASQIDNLARRFIGQSGFGKYFTHNTGHGVGLEIHELPNFSAKSADVLRAGMIVTVEPGIYIENWGGVRVEDMVIVGKRSRVLSKIPKDLRSMIIK